MRMEYGSRFYNGPLQKKGWRAGQPFAAAMRLFPEQLLQFTGLIHFAHDVRATDKLAVHI